jgi:hypothetical protein
MIGTWDSYGVPCQILEMLELNICLCHGVDARTACALQVSLCVKGELAR